MTNREAFKHNFNRLMYARECKQVDIANYLGVQKSTISQWVNGKSYPRTDMMDRIAKYFGVSIFELVNCESEEDNLLHLFRLLSPRGKEIAIERMEELKQLYWYEKESNCKSM